MAHSIGGLIVQAVCAFLCEYRLQATEQKKALSEATITDEGLFSKIALATIGIMFLGTPHRGLDLISVIRTYGRVFEAFGLATVSPMTHDLKLGSEYLQDLSARFRQVLIL